MDWEHCGNEETGLTSDGVKKMMTFHQTDDRGPERTWVLAKDIGNVVFIQHSISHPGMLEGHDRAHEITEPLRTEKEQSLRSIRSKASKVQDCSTTIQKINQRIEVVCSHSKAIHPDDKGFPFDPPLAFICCLDVVVV